MDWMYVNPDGKRVIVRIETIIHVDERPARIQRQPKKVAEVKTEAETQEKPVSPRRRESI